MLNVINNSTKINTENLKLLIPNLWSVSFDNLFFSGMVSIPHLNTR